MIDTIWLFDLDKSRRSSLATCKTLLNKKLKNYGTTEISIARQKTS